MIQHAACFTEHKRDRRKCDKKGVQGVRIFDPKTKASKNLEGSCLKGKRSNVKASK